MAKIKQGSNFSFFHFVASLFREMAPLTCRPTTRLRAALRPCCLTRLGSRHRSSCSPRSRPCSQFARWQVWNDFPIKNISILNLFKVSLTQEVHILQHHVEDKVFLQRSKKILWGNTVSSPRCYFCLQLCPVSLQLDVAVFLQSVMWKIMCFDRKRKVSI